MNALLTALAAALNRPANALGQVLLAPVAYLPGWLSATLVAAVTGALMLLAFKYTSNQSAIRQTRNEIKASLLALSLFRDNLRVCLRAQSTLLLSALHLLVLAVIPMLVLLVPMTLLLGQLSLWYQQRPLPVGEESVVALQLNGGEDDERPAVTLQSTQAVEVTRGPVRIESQRTICWTVRPLEPGYHRLEFDVGGQPIQKELAAGDGFLRVSTRRPGWHWLSVLEHPAELPFAPDSPVHEITVEFPTRDGWTCGSNSWLTYWFVASMAAAFLLRPAFNVNL